MDILAAVFGMFLVSVGFWGCVQSFREEPSFLIPRLILGAAMMSGGCNLL